MIWRSSSPRSPEMPNSARSAPTAYPVHASYTQAGGVRSGIGRLKRGDRLNQVVAGSGVQYTPCMRIGERTRVPAGTLVRSFVRTCHTCQLLLPALRSLGCSTNASSVVEVGTLSCLDSGRHIEACVPAMRDAVYTLGTFCFRCGCTFGREASRSFGPRGPSVHNPLPGVFFPVDTKAKVLVAFT